MKRIKLTQGKYALVDDSDFEYLNQFNWTTSKAISRNTHYAGRGFKRSDGKWTTMRMHREIMDAPKGMEVDHIDGNGLNNQRANLRICTRSENARNMIKRAKAYSKYKGVSWHIRYKVWYSTITISYKRKYLGRFKTELEAAIIYNIASRKYHGEFANPNKFR